jgi:hypothetical protein
MLPKTLTSHFSSQSIWLISFLFSLPFALPLQGQNRNAELNFFGTGNIQKSLDDGDEIPASTGLGVNYVQRYGKSGDDTIPKLLWNIISKLELEAAINVASTVDTIRANYDANNLVVNSSDFGSSILTPLNSGQAVKISLRLNLETGILYQLIDGVKVKYIGSNRNWSVTDDGNPRVIQANTNYFRAGFFHEFLPKRLLDDYSINFGLYLAYNSIRGDMGLKANRHIREQVLGTPWKQFVGPEVALEIRLRNLRAEFGYSWLRPNTEVPGLTAGRMVTTITFVGGFGLQLDK